MKLTKEDKEQIVARLSSIYGCVELLCDGYRITLRVERAEAMSFRVVTYVNGEWRGEWMSGSKVSPEQKFLNKRTRPAYSPKFKREMEKILGKRAFAKDPEYRKTFITYDVSWPNGKAAINHLCRVCESVQVVQNEGGSL